MPVTTLNLRALGAACSVLLLMLHAPAAQSGQCSAASGTQRVALLELYTSEGCSSCPPADRWLSRLAAGNLAPAALLPLAFHVDYWNDLGWLDPYSRAAFSDRQREHSRRRSANFVVTPQFLLNGQNYSRPLFLDDIESRTRSINQMMPRAAIRISQVRAPGQIHAQVEVRTKDIESRQAELYVALYENKLQTAVRAGENKGALLKHDFVVRELTGPVSTDADGRVEFRTNFLIEPHWKAQDLHVAAFVQHPKTGEVLQALSAACR